VLQGKLLSKSSREARRDKAAPKEAVRWAKQEDKIAPIATSTTETNIKKGVGLVAGVMGENMNAVGSKTNRSSTEGRTGQRARLGHSVCRKVDRWQREGVRRRPGHQIGEMDMPQNF